MCKVQHNQSFLILTPKHPCSFLHTFLQSKVGELKRWKTRYCGYENQVCDSSASFMLPLDSTRSVLDSASQLGCSLVSNLKSHSTVAKHLATVFSYCESWGRRQCTSKCENWWNANIHQRSQKHNLSSFPFASQSWNALKRSKISLFPQFRFKTV